MQDCIKTDAEDVLLAIPETLHLSEMLIEQVELSSIIVFEGLVQASSSQKAGHMPSGLSPPHILLPRTTHVPC